MQNKANQTDQTASNNRGEDIRRDLPEEICSIWLGIVDVFQEDNTVNYSKSLLRMVRF